MEQNWRDWIDTPIQMDCFEFMVKLPDEVIDLGVTSPPYNCRMPYGNFKDEMPWNIWYSFIKALLQDCYRVLREGGVMAFNIPLVIRWQRDHTYRDTWTDYDQDYLTHVGGKRNQRGKGRVEPVGFRVWGIMEGIGYKMREPIIWVKGSESNAICSDYRMGCDSDPYMRPCHEIVLLGSKNRWYHDGGTGRRGRDAVPFIDFTKDVWHIPPVSSNEHPAPFPIEIPLRLMKLFVHRSNRQRLPKPLVLDPLAGKFTTMIAASRLGLGCLACDINKEYVEAGQRWLKIGEARNWPLPGEICDG